MKVRVPPDVPLHRSVVADPTNMGNSQPDRFYEGFKPYVYRGTGFDILTPQLGEDAVRFKPKPKPKRKKAKPYKPRFYPYYGPEHVLEPPPEFEPERYRPEPQQDRPIRPSPGWQPMKGSDIDALLDDL